MIGGTGREQRGGGRDTHVLSMLSDCKVEMMSSGLIPVA